MLDKKPADWDVTKAARIWETHLTKYPQIDAAFFHNDDMALAAHNVMKARNRTDILIGGVDAMPPAIQAVTTAACSRPCATRPAASMAAPSSPASRPSSAARRQAQDIPKHIITDGPVVTKANAPGMQWMQEHFLI